MEGQSLEDLIGTRGGLCRLRGACWDGLYQDLHLVADVRRKYGLTNHLNTTRITVSWELIPNHELRRLQEPMLKALRCHELLTESAQFAHPLTSEPEPRLYECNSDNRIGYGPWKLWRWLRAENMQEYRDELDSALDDFHTARSDFVTRMDDIFAYSRQRFGKFAENFRYPSPSDFLRMTYLSYEVRSIGSTPDHLYKVFLDVRDRAESRGKEQGMRMMREEQVKPAWRPS